MRFSEIGQRWRDFAREQVTGEKPRVESVQEMISRREVMRRGFVAAAGTAAASAAWGECDLPYHGKVIVLGGGAGGTACAMAMAEAGVPDVHLFEAEEDVGGRTITRDLVAADGRRAKWDKGGMFADQFHFILLDLALRFGLTPVDRLQAGIDAGAPEKLWAWTNPATGLMERLHESDLAVMYQRLLPALLRDYEASENSDADYYALSNYDGGITGWLDDNVPTGDEPLKYIITNIMDCEWGVPCPEQDALNYIWYSYPYPDEYPDPEGFNVNGFADVRWQIAEGIQEIPRGCRDAFEAAGGTTHYGYKATRVKSLHGGGYKVRFEPTYGGGGGFWEHCDYVLNFVPLSQLENGNLDFSGVDGFATSGVDFYFGCGNGSGAKIVLGLDSTPFLDAGYNGEYVGRGNEGWSTHWGRNESLKTWVFYAGPYEALNVEANDALTYALATFLPDLETYWPGMTGAVVVADKTDWMSHPLHGHIYSGYTLGQVYDFYGYTEGLRFGNLIFGGEWTWGELQAWIEGALASGFYVADIVISELEAAMPDTVLARSAGHQMAVELAKLSLPPPGERATLPKSRRQRRRGIAAMIEAGRLAPLR